MKQDVEKWRAMQERSRKKYMARLANKPRKAISQHSKNEYPVAVFNADHWFRRWIRVRDGTCVTFNGECYGPLEASHAFPVSTSSIFRYDERGVHTQCRYHNQNHSSDTTLLREYIDAKHGRGTFQGMKEICLRPKLWTIPELRAIITEYKSRLDQLR